MYLKFCGQFVNRTNEWVNLPKVQRSWTLLPNFSSSEILGTVNQNQIHFSLILLWFNRSWHHVWKFSCNRIFLFFIFYFFILFFILYSLFLFFIFCYYILFFILYSLFFIFYYFLLKITEYLAKFLFLYFQLKDFYCDIPRFATREGMSWQYSSIVRERNFYPIMRLIDFILINI